MDYVRTQIYLDPAQHRRLKREAHKRDLSLAQVVREAVGEYLKGAEKAEFTKDEYMSIVGLGESASAEGSQAHDRLLGEALAGDADSR